MIVENLQPPPGYVGKRVVRCEPVLASKQPKPAPKRRENIQKKGHYMWRDFLADFPNLPEKFSVLDIGKDCKRSGVSHCLQEAKRYGMVVPTGETLTIGSCRPAVVFRKGSVGVDGYIKRKVKINAMREAIKALLVTPKETRQIASEIADRFDVGEFHAKHTIIEVMHAEGCHGRVEYLAKKYLELQGIVRVGA